MATTDTPIGAAIGSVWFVVEVSHDRHGWTRIDLRNRPESTNMSHEPRLFGWCGTTNDVRVVAKGLGRVTRIYANGRCRIEYLDGDDLDEALAELGYDELAPCNS